MNIKILLFALSVAAMSSCSTAYKSGQTPDDVYYSPVRVAEENYQQEKQKDEVKNEPVKDREIQMSVYDRRWRDFNDDYDCKYDPYHYGYSYGYYYNPYYCYYPVYITNVAITNPKNTVPRMTSLGSYNNTTYAIHNTKTGGSIYMSNPRPYNNSNNNVNNYIRRILSSPSPVNNTNNNSTRSSDNNTRTYTPSSGSSSGSSSSGSSGTSVSRPRRGG